jgi:amidohydrolase
MPSRYEALIRRELSWVTELRHSLHRIPELCFEEHETSALIRRELDRLGLPHTDGVPGAPTATVSVFGPRGKPCVALRADIDGLPMTEQTNLPWASRTPGRMHACGHDGHTAALLGTAAILKQLEGELPARVMLIFQPAEEGGGGGKKLMDAGLATGELGAEPQAIFGLHGWPALPTGRVSSKPGPLLAATDTFTITVHGQGGHAAMPQNSSDPITAAAGLVLSLQQVVSRDLDPTEPAVVSVTQVHGGTAFNVIPETVTIKGTARTLTPAAREAVQAAIRQRATGVTGGGCTAEVQWHDGYPPTVNDAAAFAYVARTVKQAFGPSGFLPAARATMGGEDFSYYLEKIPGCFFLVGLQHEERPHPGLHTETFDFTDAALPTAMTMFVNLVMNFPRWRSGSDE